MKISRIAIGFLYWMATNHCVLEKIPTNRIKNPQKIIAMYKIYTTLGKEIETEFPLRISKSHSGT